MNKNKLLYLNNIYKKYFEIDLFVKISMALFIMQSIYMATRVLLLSNTFPLKVNIVDLLETKISTYTYMILFV